MPTTFYGEVFSFPLAARVRRTGRAVSEDLEFSEYGRSAKIPAGWYLAPALLVWPIVLAVALI